jgi:hypothetical protein
VKRAQSSHPDLFAGELLPCVALPTIGFVAKACGEWHRYCKGWGGFNAVLPISWNY